VRISVSHSQGTNLCRRSRRAHSSQNLRLVQTRHFRRSSFSPQSAQKFGLYIPKTLAKRNFEGLLDNPKQRKACRARPKLAIESRLTAISAIAKSLACPDTL
jgi:hypothetical protein